MIRREVSWMKTKDGDPDKELWSSIPSVCKSVMKTDLVTSDEMCAP